MQKLLALALVCAPLVSGCGGGSSETVVVASGTLVVDWTVDGSTDPELCDQADAASLRLSVFTDSGAHVGDFLDDCRAFSTALDLDPGGYDADAVLEDRRGNPRTTTIAIEPFFIEGADTLSIPIDFPADSFL
jgi:hypothetical protein